MPWELPLNQIKFIQNEEKIMKNIWNAMQKHQIRMLIFTFLLLSVSACVTSQSRENSKIERAISQSKDGGIEKVKAKTDSKTGTEDATGTDDNLKKKVCKKLESCGCQDYEECMADAEDLDYPDAVWECMLKSSCESLCAEKPDGCKKSGDNPKTTAPDVPDCSRTRCSKNGDCPGGCHGGCIDGYCSLF